MNRVAQSTDSLRRSKALLTIWLSRHLPNLELVSRNLSPLMQERISSVIAPDAREASAVRLLSHLSADCAFASHGAAQTVKPTRSDTDEGQTDISGLNRQIIGIFRYLIERYRRSFVFRPILETCEQLDSSATRRLLTARVLPAFQQLVADLEPYLTNLREVCGDTVSRQRLLVQLQQLQRRMLDHLGFYERLWLAPYLNLVEDLLCLPWQRLCETAVLNSATPGAIAIVYHRLPKLHTIATDVYRHVVSEYPALKEALSSQDQTQIVQALKTAQAQLWLHMLERTPTAIETAMIPTWLALYHSTPITWSFIEKSLAALVDAMAEPLLPKQQAFFLKYARAAQELVTKADPEQMNATQLKSWIDELWSQPLSGAAAGPGAPSAPSGETPVDQEASQLETMVNDIWESSAQPPAQKEPKEEPFVKYARSMQRLTSQAKNAAGNQEQLRHLMKEAWLVYISA